MVLKYSIFDRLKYNQLPNNFPFIYSYHIIPHISYQKVLMKTPQS